MLGNGLQSSLLSIRADLEGFSTTITGLIMSTFYIGFLLDSLLTPKLTQPVGHIRVLAALSALPTATILLHALFIDVSVWIALRLLSGFCIVGLYIAAKN